MDNTLVRVEFDNIVVKIKNERIADAIKTLVIGKKPKARGGYKKHMWSEDDHNYLAHALKTGQANGEQDNTIFRKVAVVLGVTENACAARAFKYGLTRGAAKNSAQVNKPIIEEFEIQ